MMMILNIINQKLLRWRFRLCLFYSCFVCVVDGDGLNQKAYIIILPRRSYSIIYHFLYGL